MWLDELSGLVDNLRECINNHRDTLTKSESTTRYALIDPILSKIGWRLADPAHVLTEYAYKSRRFDYAMWHNKRVVLVVEAKALGSRLEEGELLQTISYCSMVGCQHFVMTNGDTWEGYDLSAVGDIVEKRRLDFSVTGRHGIMDLFWLWPGNFESTPARPNVHRHSKREPGRSTKAKSQETSPNSVALAGFRYKKGMRKPLQLAFPDGVTKDVSSWARVQVATAMWLIETRRVEGRTPLENTHGTYLINQEPRRANGSDFLDPREVGNGLWIEMHYSPANHLKKTQEMLVACDVDPTTVQIVLGAETG